MSKVVEKGALWNMLCVIIKRLHFLTVFPEHRVSRWS